MTLALYQIAHPNKPNNGAEFRAMPCLDSKENIGIVIRSCIGRAKKSATENGVQYSEMIHKLDGRIVNPDQILSLC